MRTFTLIAAGAAALGAALLVGPAAAAGLPRLSEAAEQQQQQQVPMSCPALEVTLKTSVNWFRGTWAGKAITLTGRVKNTGDVAMEDVAMGFHLPADGALCRTKATLYPNPRTQEAALRTDGGANVYWEGLTLGAGKWRKFELVVEVSAELAAESGVLEVAALAYRLAEECITVTEPEKITVKALGAGKTTTNSPAAVCAADPPPPDTRRALAVAAENQRCGEASEVIVSDERRPGNAGVRKLVTKATQDTCWAQCLAAGLRLPFYMSVEESARGGNKCFCSDTCSPVYREGVKVHQVNRQAKIEFAEKAKWRR